MILTRAGGSVIYLECASRTGQHQVLSCTNEDGLDKACGVGASWTMTIDRSGTTGKMGGRGGERH